MLGAAIGDIAGSVFEFDDSFKSTEFPLFPRNAFFTDDSVCTAAVADWLLQSRGSESAAPFVIDWCARYPHAGFGCSFAQWLQKAQTAAPCSQRSVPPPYNSWGNGSAMRVSPVGWAFDSLEATLQYAEKSAAITHNHPEGIKGAQATAAAIFWARCGESKEFIRAQIEQHFGYDLSRSCDQIRPDYRFDESCQGTVPEAITAFLEGRDFEHALRLAISLGGDSDTLAAITCSIAEAYYPIPPFIREQALAVLSPDIARTLLDFESRYGKHAVRRQTVSFQL